MALTLSVAEPRPEGAPADFTLEGESATIGRSANCDWTLPDAKNYISSRHAELRRDGDGYVFKDISTNGTFLNGAAERMTEERRIADGDSFKIGPYAVTAKVAADVVAPPPPPEPVPAAPAAPDRTVFAPAADAAPAPAPAPADPQHTVFAPGPDEGGAPGEEEVALAPEQEALWEKVAGANSIDWDRGGFGADDRAAATQAVVAATADELANAYLTAAGIERAKITAEAPEAIVRGGSLLRRLVAGLVIMVESRARAKAQMGAEATQLQLDGNNPIKFARTPEAALAQLLNPTQKGFLDAEKAIEDAFVDIQSHQVATMAAIPGALRQTLERFSPGSIKRRADNIGLLARILPAARDAALWNNYEKEFNTVASQSDEAFMEVFSKEFRKAYAKQIAKGRP